MRFVPLDFDLNIHFGHEKLLGLLRNGPQDLKGRIINKYSPQIQVAMKFTHFCHPFTKQRIVITKIGKNSRKVRENYVNWEICQTLRKSLVENREM